MLDERARALLNYAKKDDIIVFTSNALSGLLKQTFRSAPWFANIRSNAAPHSRRFAFFPARSTTSL